MSKIKEDYEKMKDQSLNKFGDIDRRSPRKNIKDIPIEGDPKEYEIPDEKEESTNIINTKLNIYEAYDNGYITESEKNDLLLMVEEVAVSKKKQKILDNQDELKENFNKISSDLKKMVISNAGDIKLEMTDKKFFRNHEDHKEQHYLLEYTLKPSDDIPKSKIAKVLLDIGNAVEKEFKKDKKDFLNKGLYFDNEKKDETTRFVELHYDFY